MLSGHHFCRATGPRSNLRVVECLDDGVLIQRPSLFHCSFPELQSAVRARTGTARREHRAARIAFIVLVEQFHAEWIGYGLIVVEASVQTLHLRGWQKLQQIFLEVGTHELSAPLRESGVVKL